MTIGIDTSRIHSETYKEYSKHKHTCVSYQDFLLVKILRLQNELRECQEAIDWTEVDIEDMAGGGH